MSTKRELVNSIFEQVDYDGTVRKQYSNIVTSQFDYLKMIPENVRNDLSNTVLQVCEDAIPELTELAKQDIESLMSLEQLEAFDNFIKSEVGKNAYLNLLNAQALTTTRGIDYGQKVLMPKIQSAMLAVIQEYESQMQKHDEDNNDYN